ncbi:MAG: type I glyceraldehyde-3-phosphate dehydrogenase [Gammaproteobacteria bacterium]|nr:type I glyceraldehyde-3-phosphate dehydrogenase [Gammaproteobacteria bacterium]NVK88829.1 type I glyceraldehyde-3-phosphate dehydrogenase [Gammaproteobacteria bacterium]
MTIRVAINGFGRIGRNILRALVENPAYQHIEVVAINDLAPLEVNAHLTEFDSVHGRLQALVAHDDTHLIINNQPIRYLQQRDLVELPWQALEVDLVFECTGAFTSRTAAANHLKAGAQKVIISAPAKDADLTVVYGVNHHKLTSEHQIISNASCTTNCLAPLAQILEQQFGIEQGLMTTIHAYTGDQRLTDTSHSDLRRARAADLSMIPTKTGAAAAVGLVLPELSGKLDGLAIRVPTANVSLVDLTVTLTRATTVAEVNEGVRQAAAEHYANIIDVNDKPLVSIDFNHNPHSCIFDATQTRVDGKMAKLFAWYDNEWGYSNRMLDTATALMMQSHQWQQAS